MSRGPSVANYKQYMLPIDVHSAKVTVKSVSVVPRYQSLAIILLEFNASVEPMQVLCNNTSAHRMFLSVCFTCGREKGFELFGSACACFVRALGLDHHIYAPLAPR